MDSENLKLQIGSNIAMFRKQCGMTQAELAEKLNYSDKAVSKWERGESVPDVMTLVQLAELFGVGMDALVGCEPAAAAVKTPDHSPKRQVNKNVIQMLVSILVWFVALFVYVVLSSMNVPKSWIGFVYAVPANAIVLLSLRSAWKKFGLNIVLISAIVWGSLLSFYLTMLIFTGYNIWKLFLLGIMGQVAIFLWFRMFHGPKEENDG
jgi:transcriptional regulator with XRE-family HTH domain